MSTEKIYIEQFLELARHYPVIDVRSPGEYNHAHIPGACNLPLFTDEERAVVGTKYKQESREDAIKAGLDFFGPKMKKMIEEADKIIKNKVQSEELNYEPGEGPAPNSKILLIYCWRGGMRSAAIAWLMDLYGFKVYLLIGGYKKFRNYVLETFQLPFQFKILGGYTGSGKTSVLHELKRNGETVIDLEDIAKHKGSAFGNISMPPQPTQEMFENILSGELRAIRLQQEENSSGKAGTIWLEDESQRIGLVNIPNALWNNMRQSPVYFLDIPFEERLHHLAREYGKYDMEKLIDATQRISRRLGNLETRNTISLLLQENILDSFRILLTYYDRWYLRGLHNRENLNSLLNTVKCDSVNPLNSKKLIPQPAYHENV